MSQSQCRTALRTAVYSLREKLLLVQLVKEYSVVENKRTDGATVAEKNRAWETLTSNYNSQPEVNTPRTPQQLRKLWNNLKQRKRKETTALRHDMLATGGGPAEIPNPDPVLEFVAEAAGGLDVTVNCPWDSTHLFERAGITSTLEIGDTEEPQEVAVEVLFSDNSLEEPVPYNSKGSNVHFFTANEAENPVPSTSKGTRGNFPRHFLSGEAKAKEPPVPCAVSTTSIKGLISKKGMLLTEQRRNQQVETTHQQQEIFNLKNQILKEELLRVNEERARAAQRGEIDLQRAADEARKAADDAEPASLNLKQFKKEISSVNHEV